MTSHEVWVKSFLFPSIEDGSKSLEVRIGGSYIRNIRVGDNIIFKTDRRNCSKGVQAVRRYDSFKAMLEVEPVEKISPGSTKEELLRFLHGIYHPKRVEQNGVYVFELAS